MVMIAEFLGSLGLIFGFLTRLSALGIISVMLGAILTVHKQYGFFMNWMGKQAGEGFEYHLLAIGIAIALLIRGGGAFSIDRALEGQQK
jgi:putative oxidoreductase